MMRIWILLLSLSLAALLSDTTISDHAHAQQLSAVPVDLEVPLAPTPVKAGL